MKYTIEIARFKDDGTYDVLHRASSNAIGPKWAKAKAQTLLQSYRGRGANGARITNHHGEEVYHWRGD